MRVKTLCVFPSCLLATALSINAQDRKPGLYEVTMVTTTVAPTPNTYPPRTTQACLTQEMIDKYGAIVPENLTRSCQLANVVKRSGGMSAELVCSGAINGNGKIEVNWSDSEHAKANLHFSGTIRPGANEIKVEWNAETTSVYKGPDCSALNPTPPPAPPPPPTPAPDAE